MAEFLKTKLGIDHKFNPNSKRHFLNKTQSVYHCHHYSTLYTQLAIDAGETELLANASEDSIHEVLSKYFRENNITDIDERVQISCKYYSAMGLGTLDVQFMGNDSGKVVSKSSHLEEGWIKKWKKFDQSVNYIGCGYVSALLAAVLDKPAGTYKTFESASIVKGDPHTVFNSYKK